MTFQLEKFIPIPSRRGYSGNERLYPFPDMQPGDSFFIPAGGQSGKTVGMAAFCWAREEHRKNPETPRIVFSIRTIKTEPAGVRCWRVK